MRTLCFSVSTLLCAILAHTFLRGQEAATTVQPLKQWTGMVADKNLEKEMPPRSLAFNQAAVDRLWKAWGRSDATPRVDFVKEVVVVATSDLEVHKVSLEGDEKGNYLRRVQIEKNEARGFSYGIAIFPRTGIKTINGVVLLQKDAVKGGVEPAYPDTADGLKRLMTDIYTATKDGDKKKASELIKALALPKHEAWFKDAFGNEKGGSAGAEYVKLRERLEPDLEQLFGKIVKEGQSEINIRRFDKAPDPQAVGLQNDALAAMKAPRALYSVRFVKPGERLGQHVYSFVYAEGGFRLVGKMQAALQ